jgi:hypothetical protein
MGMNEEVFKRLNDDSWDKQISLQVSAKIEKKKSQLKIAYSSVILLFTIFISFGLYYKRITTLSDEYYNLYSIFIGEDIAFFDLIE